MCGIAGYIGKAAVNRRQIDRTLGLMVNRGPDHRAFVERSHGGLRVVLLHSRLAIIDLDPRSNQPFERAGVSLVFNGEIYNYVELRRDLALLGRRFTTESDTEVLLEAYREWGLDALSRMEGMWAFALFDSARSELVLSRDRFAEKPLYLSAARDGFFFGSETRFVRSLAGETFHVNGRQVLRYLVNGYRSLHKTRETFYEGISELPNASVTTIGGDLVPRDHAYWAPRYSPSPIAPEEAARTIRSLIADSMRIRLRSDVPLAFCLSGGVDSGSLASIAAKELGCDVASYSIVDPDPRYNEVENIQATLRDIGWTNTLVPLVKESSLARLRRQVEYHDAPEATIAYYLHSYLCERIAADGRKVAFSGTGADELFTGYYDHFLMHIAERNGHPDHLRLVADWRRHVRPIVRNPHLSNESLFEIDPAFRDHLYMRSDVYERCLKVPFHEAFREEAYSDSLLRNRMMNEIFHEATRVVLHEDDLNSMCYSIENRSPYLDSRLFAFAYSIPNEILIRDGYAKVLLRDAMNGTLNEQVRLDRRKKGFNGAIHSFLDLDSADVRDGLLGESPVFDLVKRDQIEKLMALPDLTNSDSKFLFSFINAKLFLEIGEN